MIDPALFPGPPGQGEAASGRSVSRQHCYYPNSIRNGNRPCRNRPENERNNCSLSPLKSGRGAGRNRKRRN